MKNNFLIISFLVSFFYFPSLMALELELGVGARSMGQVVEVGKKLGNSFNVRIAIGNDYESGDIEYSSSDEIEVESVLSGDVGQWSASHSSLLIDYHPWQGNFRLTLGLTDNSLTWSAKNNGAISIGGNSISQDVVDFVEAEVQFTDGMSPYIGLGWASGFDKVKGFSFNGDIGVFATSNFVVLFDANCIDGQFDSAGCQKAKQDAKAELKELQADEKISLLPLLGLGVSYKF
jgi:hypothetical protein